MSQRRARTLQELMTEKKLTPRDVMNRGAEVSDRELAQWAKTGERTQWLEANERCLSVSRALSVPPEEFDCGPNRRGMSDGDLRLFLRSRGRDDTGWRASIASYWYPPEKDLPQRAIMEVLIDSNNPLFSAEGPTEQAAFDALEEQLRELIRANPGLRSRVHNPEAGDA